MFENFIKKKTWCEVKRMINRMEQVQTGPGLKLKYIYRNKIVTRINKFAL